MKASPALLAATALVLTSFAYAQANSDKTPAPQAKPAPTTHRGGAPGHAGNGAPQPAPGMAITEQGITNSKPKPKPHTKVENSGDPHENMNGREAGSGMATGRRTADAHANANAEIHGREAGSGMATGRRTHMPPPQSGRSGNAAPANGTATH